MANDVLLNKAAVIERCVQRILEEYAAAGDGFATDYSHQDAAILNIQRACEASIDIGQHVIREKKLGLPQSSRHVFELLYEADYIDEPLAETLKKMVGFRNIAVHDYQRLLLPITTTIITQHLDDFLLFSSTMLQKNSTEK
jgi:uncharacterized protein YutE (UPF0331/DUF86 family)